MTRLYRHISREQTPKSSPKIVSSCPTFPLPAAGRTLVQGRMLVHHERDQWCVNISSCTVHHLMLTLAVEPVHRIILYGEATSPKFM